MTVAVRSMPGLSGSMTAAMSGAEPANSSTEGMSAMFSPVPPTVTISPVACPAVPPSVHIGVAAPTSLTFRYHSVCGNEPLAVLLFGDSAGRNRVGLQVTPWGDDSGTLTFTGLSPATDYYFSYADADRYWEGPGPFGPVTTLPEGSVPSETALPSPTVTEGPRPTASQVPQPTVGESPARCRATFTVLSRWNGGYLASVKITSTGTAPALWKVSWTWTGDETVTGVSNAVLGGTAAQPRLTGVPWNEILAPGASAEVFVQGSGSPDVITPVLGCVH